MLLLLYMSLVRGQCLVQFFVPLSTPPVVFGDGLTEGVTCRSR